MNQEVEILNKEILEELILKINSRTKIRNDILEKDLALEKKI